VFAVHRIDEQLAKAMDRKVWLPSGGTLVIDRTEAMTVVDVNTGKFTGAGGNLEQTVTRNNLEAAEEIVRQLRLRDIGGIIVVDFIDMVLESNRDLVLRRLTEALARDRTRHQVSEVTSLGLVQLTRKRLGTGLIEAFSTQCSHCAGRGILLHADPIDSAPATGRKSDSGRRGKRGKKGGKAEDVPVVKVPAHSSEHPMFKAMQAANGKHEDDDETDEETTGEGKKPAEEVAEADTDAIEQAVVASADEETEDDDVDEVDEDDDSDDDDDDDSDEIDLDDVDEDDEDDDDIEVIDSDDDDDDDDDDSDDDDDEDDDDESDDDDEDDDEEAATATVGGRRPRRRSAARPAGPPALDD
jgi:ribonuclease E